jgi:hypothetical protein
MPTIPSWHAVLSDPGEFDVDRSRQRRRYRPSPCSDRLGTPEYSRNPFHARELFRGFSGSHIATAYQVACPLYGSDRIAPAIGGFYFWASGRSVTLPTSRYDYSSDWTPLLVRLSLTGMAASLAAPEPQLMSEDRTKDRQRCSLRFDLKVNRGATSVVRSFAVI